MGAKKLEMHCKHKRVFEGGDDRVRTKPEMQKEKAKKEEM